MIKDHVRLIIWRMEFGHAFRTLLADLVIVTTLSEDRFGCDSRRVTILIIDH